MLEPLLREAARRQEPVHHCFTRSRIHVTPERCIGTRRNMEAHQQLLETSNTPPCEPSLSREACAVDLHRPSPSPHLRHLPCGKPTKTLTNSSQFQISFSSSVDESGGPQVLQTPRSIRPLVSVPRPRLPRPHREVWCAAEAPPPTTDFSRRKLKVRTVDNDKSLVHQPVIRSKRGKFECERLPLAPVLPPRRGAVGRVAGRQISRLAGSGRCFSKRIGQETSGAGLIYVVALTTRGSLHLGVTNAA